MRLEAINKIVLRRIIHQNKMTILFFQLDNIKQFPVLELPPIIFFYITTIQIRMTYLHIVKPMMCVHNIVFIPISKKMYFIIMYQFILYNVLYLSLIISYI